MFISWTNMDTREDDSPSCHYLHCFNLPPPSEPTDLHYVCFYGVVRTLYHLLDSNARYRIRPLARINLPNSQFQVGQSMTKYDCSSIFQRCRPDDFLSFEIVFFLSSNVRNYKTKYHFSICCTSRLVVQTCSFMRVPLSPYHVIAGTSLHLFES